MAYVYFVCVQWKYWVRKLCIRNVAFRFVVLHCLIAIYTINANVNAISPIQHPMNDFCWLNASFMLSLCLTLCPFSFSSGYQGHVALQKTQLIIVIVFNRIPLDMMWSCVCLFLKVFHLCKQIKWEHSGHSVSGFKLNECVWQSVLNSTLFWIWEFACLSFHLISKPILPLNAYVVLCVAQNHIVYSFWLLTQSAQSV